MKTASNWKPFSCSCCCQLIQWISKCFAAMSHFEKAARTKVNYDIPSTRCVKHYAVVYAGVCWTLTLRSCVLCHYPISMFMLAWCVENTFKVGPLNKSVREWPLNKPGGVGFFLGQECFFCNTLEPRNFFQGYMEPIFFFTNSTLVTCRQLSETFFL